MKKPTIVYGPYNEPYNEENNKLEEHKLHQTAFIDINGIGFLPRRHLPTETRRAEVYSRIFQRIVTREATALEELICVFTEEDPKRTMWMAVRVPSALRDKVLKEFPRKKKKARGVTSGLKVRRKG